MWRIPGSFSEVRLRNRENQPLWSGIVPKHKRAARKVLPPMLLCWPTRSEEDVGIEVEAEPSHQYSVTFCSCVIDGSRGAVQQSNNWCNDHGLYVIAFNV